jgi:diaminopimelate epimerase
MIYYNADGTQTFCGNGGRCAVAFAKKLGIIKNKTTFLAVDGAHIAEIENDIISLKMIDVNEIEEHKNSVFMYTGTQHHVEIVEELTNFPVFEKGKKIRESYESPGSNVNFVQQINETTFRVRTYEKGVENETLACGTGVTAVAIAMHKTNKTESNLISLPVEGGVLKVSFTEENGTYKNVFLKGPAQFVFKGIITV